MRRLLSVAYFFPPVGGVSVPRTLGFVRHLPEHGWSPTVLTPRRASHHLHDPGGLALVPPGTRVVRTGIIEPSDVMRLARLVLGLVPGRRARGAGPRPAPPSASRLSRWRRTLFFPDDHVGWVPWAALAGLRAHRRNPFDAVYSSSSPVTAHLVAGIVARLTGIPWVAEFRDPWVGNALAPRLPWLHRALSRRLERWIVDGADACVFVTPSLTALYRRRYPSRAERFSTVTNGYDLGALAPVPGPAALLDDRPTTLVYTGTVDRPAELGAFLDGLRAWRRRGGDDRLCVEFIGHASDACRVLLDAAVDAAGPGSVRYSGFVPRDVAARRLREADAALVLLGSGPGMGLFVSGKLFEYLGADVPIFAVVPPGDARAILEELEWGVIADPDPESVANGLDRLLEPRSERTIADPARRYERRTVVRALASVLDSVAPAGTGR